MLEAEVDVVSVTTWLELEVLLETSCKWWKALEESEVENGRLRLKIEGNGRLIRGDRTARRGTEMAAIDEKVESLVKIKCSCSSEVQHQSSREKDDTFYGNRVET